MIRSPLTFVKFALIVVSVIQLVVECNWLKNSDETSDKLTPASLKIISDPIHDIPFTKESIACRNSTIKAPCGSSKCFFQLPSHPDLGYVVTNYNEHALLSGQSYRNWTVRLQEQYGISPLPLGPPQIIRKAPKNLLNCLNGKRWKANSEDQHLPNFRESNGRLLVQLNRAAPSPSILFKCVDFLEEFLNSEEFQGYWEGISDYPTFLETIQHESELAQRVLIDWPDLLIDFQVLVDQTGKFHYIDLGHRKPGRWHLTLSGKRLHERKEICALSFPVLDKVAHEQARRHGQSRSISASIA